MKEKIKITLLCNGDDEFGVLTAMYNFMNAVDNYLGWEIQTVCVSDGPAAQALSRRYKTHILNFPYLSGLSGNPVSAIFRWLIASFRISKSIQEIGLNADVLHVQWPKLLIVAGITSKKLEATCIWEMPNTISNRAFGINRLIYQIICKTYKIQPLANSEFTAKTLGSALVRPWVCHLSANEKKFNPQVVGAVDRQLLGISDEDIVFCLAARFDLTKGQVNMVQSLSSLEPTVHLLLIGGPLDGEVVSLVRSTALKNGVLNRVHCVGVVNDPEKYFLASDVVVNMRLDPEPFGLTIVEAMMMGKPVLAHSLGGPKEIIIDGETGWLLDSIEPECIVRGIKRVLGDREKWKGMGMRARIRAIKNFSLEAQAKRIENSVLALKNMEKKAP